MSHVSFALRRRAAAVGALLLLFGGLVSVARGFVESPLAILIALAALFVAIGFGWVALTRRGRDRTRATWVSVILLMVAFIAALGAHSEGWTMVLGGIAIVGSLGLGRFALGVDRRTIEKAPPPGVPVSPARKPVLLVNPLSGGGKAKDLNLVERAGEAGIETHTFGPGADLGDLGAGRTGQWCRCDRGGRRRRVAGAGRRTGQQGGRADGLRAVGHPEPFRHGPRPGPQ